MYTYHHETPYKDSPWIEDVIYRFQGQKIKGQGHNALIAEKLMSHNCFPFSSINLKLHTKTPNESRMCTMDFGVKR